MSTPIFIRLSIWFVLLFPHLLQAQTADSLTSKLILNSIEHDRYDDAFSRLASLKDHYQEGVDVAYLQLLLKVASAVSEKGNYELGLTYSFEALNLAAANGFEDEETRAMLELSYICYYLEQLDLSTDYAQQAKTRAQSRNNLAQTASAINLIGLNEQHRGNFESALAKFDSALFIRKALKLSHGISAVLGNIGLLKAKTGRLKEALLIQQRALAIDDSIHDEIGVAWSRQMLGALSLQMKNLTDAEMYLSQAESTAKQKRLSELLVQVYKNKQELLKAQQDWTGALQYAELAQQLRDSIHGKALMGRVMSLQSAYLLDAKTREIAKQRETLDKQRFYIVIGTGVTVMIALFGFFYYRSFKTVAVLNREIAAQKEEIQAQAEELEESNRAILNINETLEDKVRDRTTALVQAYNDLDTFFYRSSHDFRQPLTTFMGLAEVARITVKDKQALELFERVTHTAVSLDKLLTKMQSISDIGLHELEVDTIYVNELFNAVFTVHQQNLLQAGVRFDTKVGVDSFRSFPTLIKLVVENLVENAITFNSGIDSFVKLVAYPNGKDIIIEVSDNGQGIHNDHQHQVFDMYYRANEFSRGHGLGLYVVKKAMDHIQGTITFNSEPNRGTIFHVRIPVSV